jgi:hypothetical protein
VAKYKYGLLMVNSHLYDKEKKVVLWGLFYQNCKHIKNSKNNYDATMGMNADQTSTRDQVMTTMSNQTSTVYMEELIGTVITNNASIHICNPQFKVAQ